MSFCHVYTVCFVSDWLVISTAMAGVHRSPDDIGRLPNEGIIFGCPRCGRIFLDPVTLGGHRYAGSCPWTTMCMDPSGRCRGSLVSHCHYRPNIYICTSCHAIRRSLVYFDLHRSKYLCMYVNRCLSYLFLFRLVMLGAWMENYTSDYLLFSKQPDWCSHLAIENHFYDIVGRCPLGRHLPYHQTSPP